MSQTLIGVFDSKTDAQRAVDVLTQRGFTQAHIEMHAHDDYLGSGAALEGSTTGVAGEAGTGTVRAADTHDESLMTRIEHFFGRLFGSHNDYPEEVGHYSEAVRRGGTLVAVEAVDDERVESARDVLWQNGAVDIDERVARWRDTGYSGFDRTAQPFTREQAENERNAFSVVKEDLEVGKRQVNTGGVRVYSRVTETPVSESVSLREEHATIERRPVDRPATAADLKEGWTEVTNSEERAVVSKSARVVEEVVVGKEASQRTETVNETLRGTEVEVEQIPSGTTGTERTLDERRTTSTLDPAGSNRSDLPLDAETTLDPTRPPRTPL